MPSDCPSHHPDGTPCQEQHPDHTLHHAHPGGVADCLRWVDPGDTTTRIPTTCKWLLVDQVEAGVVRLTAKAEARRAERVIAALQEGRLDGRAPKARLRRPRGADRMRQTAAGEQADLRVPTDVLRPERPGASDAVQWQVLCPRCGDAGIERDGAVVGERGEVSVQLRCAARHAFELTVANHKGAEYIAITA